MSVLATLGAAAINNAMSEWHANKADQRARNLMDKQNQMNQANALMAYTNQVQGMRMAGLNPALSQNLGNAPVQNVSQGTGAKGENVEINPQDLLLDAQIENVKADTDKKRAEVSNVNEDTNLKIAQTAYTGATEEKVNEEAQNIRNINDQYRDQNKVFSEHGKEMAEEWKKTGWYLNADNAVKGLVDKVANGSIPLTVGSMKALVDASRNSAGMSDDNKQRLAGSLGSYVIREQLMNPDIIGAMAEMPEKTRDKLVADMKKISAEIPELISRKYLNSANAGYALESTKTEENKRQNLDAGTVKSYNEAATSMFQQDYYKSMTKYQQQVTEEVQEKLRQLKAEFERSVEMDPKWTRGKNTLSYLSGKLDEMINSVPGIVGLIFGGKAIAEVRGAGDNMHTPISNQKKRGETFYKEGLSDWTTNPRNHPGDGKSRNYDGRVSPLDYRYKTRGGSDQGVQNMFTHY